MNRRGVRRQSLRTAPSGSWRKYAARADRTFGWEDGPIERVGIDGLATMADSLTDAISKSGRSSDDAIKAAEALVFGIVKSGTHGVAVDFVARRAIEVLGRARYVEIFKAATEQAEADRAARRAAIYDQEATRFKAVRPRRAAEGAAEQVTEGGAA